MGRSVAFELAWGIERLAFLLTKACNGFGLAVMQTMTNYLPTQRLTGAREQGGFVSLGLPVPRPVSFATWTLPINARTLFVEMEIDCSSTYGLL